MENSVFCVAFLLSTARYSALIEIVDPHTGDRWVARRPWDCVSDVRTRVALGGMLSVDKERCNLYADTLFRGTSLCMWHVRDWQDLSGPVGQARSFRG